MKTNKDDEIKTAIENINRTDFANTTQDKNKYLDRVRSLIKTLANENLEILQELNKYYQYCDFSNIKNLSSEYYCVFINLYNELKKSNEFSSQQHFSDKIKRLEEQAKKLQEYSSDPIILDLLPKRSEDIFADFSVHYIKNLTISSDNAWENELPEKTDISSFGLPYCKALELFEFYKIKLFDKVKYEKTWGGNKKRAPSSNKIKNNSSDVFEKIIKKNT